MLVYYLTALILLLTIAGNLGVVMMRPAIRRRLSGLSVTVIDERRRCARRRLVWWTGSIFLAHIPLDVLAAVLPVTSAARYVLLGAAVAQILVSVIVAAYWWSVGREARNLMRGGQLEAR